ncbi:hypothetical protein ABFS82_02G147500 [Erythranthe guttata]
MSITLSLVAIVLLLVLQCFSFHACNARSFAVVRNETITKKNEDKLNIPARVSTKSSKEDSRFEKDEAGKNIQAKGNIPVEVSSGATRVASVSWTVPHKKRGEQEPGFNLDYLPPKTHPPVHN